MENLMGIFKNTPENKESEKLTRGKEVIDRLFSDPKEINSRLDKINQ